MDTAAGLSCFYPLLVTLCPRIKQPLGLHDLICHDRMLLSRDALALPPDHGDIGKQAQGDHSTPLILLPLPDFFFTRPAFQQDCIGKIEILYNVQCVILHAAH